MSAIDVPVRCTLAEIGQHPFVVVEATIVNVGVTDNPCTVILSDTTGTELRVRVYPTTFALASEHLFDGYQVIVSGYTAEDDAGTFLVAHTIHGCEDVA